MYSAKSTLCGRALYKSVIIIIIIIIIDAGSTCMKWPLLWIGYV